MSPLTLLTLISMTNFHSPPQKINKWFFFLFTGRGLNTFTNSQNLTDEASIFLTFFLGQFVKNLEMSQFPIWKNMSMNIAGLPKLNQDRLDSLVCIPLDHNGQLETGLRSITSKEQRCKSARPCLSIYYVEWNTSLVVKGALAYRMQRGTVCKIQYSHQGAQK